MNLHSFLSSVSWIQSSVMHSRFSIFSPLTAIQSSSQTIGESRKIPFIMWFLISHRNKMNFWKMQRNRPIARSIERLSSLGKFCILWLEVVYMLHSTQHYRAFQVISKLYLFRNKYISSLKNPSIRMKWLFYFDLSRTSMIIIKS